MFTRVIKGISPSFCETMVKLGLAKRSEGPKTIKSEHIGGIRINPESQCRKFYTKDYK